MLTGRSVETHAACSRQHPQLLMARIAALLIVIGGTLLAGPASAQFGDIFGGGPPRPPADVPNGPFPQQPAPPPYPDRAPQQAYPGGAPAPGYPGDQPNYRPPPPQSAIEAQPLPPPGGSAAPLPPPSQRYPQRPAAAPPLPQRAAVPPPGGAPAANTPPPGSTLPPAAEVPAPDDTVVEAPTPHIDNRRAVFAGLDKITGRTISFDVGIGETVQFGALQVTPRACYTRPPTEATNTDSFVEVDEVTLKGDIKRIFTGWMFASSPGLNAVEHPIYDVWLTGCESPVEAQAAEPVRPAQAAAHVRPPAKPVRRPPASVNTLQPQPR